MPLSIFPLHRFGPETLKADVVEKVVSGGTALNDVEDVIATDGGGRWEGAIRGLSLNPVWAERLWSAWTSYFGGGARQFLMPIYSLRTAPRPVGGNGLLRPSGLVANDAVFPTSVAFASPYIVAQSLDAVPLRGTTMRINVAQGARIEPGMRFSCGVRGFKVERVTSVSGLVATCIVGPPAREPIAAGAALNFDWPVVLCKITPGQDLAPEMAFGRFGSIGVAFAEDCGDVA